MTKRVLAIPIVSALVLLVATGYFFGPSLRRNNPAVSPSVTTVLLEQARTDFDAPLLELASFPFYRVVGFSGSSGKVAVYHRLGFRIATMTIDGCKSVGSSFSCGGDHIDYGLGW